jgi:hypothetical protein
MSQNKHFKKHLSSFLLYQWRTEENHLLHRNSVAACVCKNIAKLKCLITTAVSASDHVFLPRYKFNGEAWCVAGKAEPQMPARY